MCMRLDYIMYVVAGLFFVVTIISYVAISMEMTEHQLWVVSTVVLGLLSIGFGYFQRPKALMQAPQTSIQSNVQSNVAVSETVVPQTIQIPAEPVAVVEKPPVIENTVTVESPTQPLSPTPSPATETTTLPDTQPVTHVKRSQVKRLKGIGQKRAAQLNALGISSFEELANASAEDVAKSLQISPKIVKRWISEAKLRAK